MDPAIAVASIISSLGGGALLLAIVNFTFKQVTGRAGREKERNTTLATQRADAILERDAANERANDADRKRRLAMDEVSRLRGMLLERGISPGPDLDLDRTLTKAQLKRLRETEES